jgi:G3E family GTPase
MLQGLGVTVEEVTGGCFCCRFDDLAECLERILKQNPDVLMGELVGSCADFAATVGNPIKLYYPDVFRLAPFSVLVDPDRVREFLLAEVKTPFPDEVSYLFHKQLEEADIILLNKVDLLSDLEREKLTNLLEEHFPQRPILAISAKEEKGLDEWLDMLMEEIPSAKRILELDYDRYATAEAVLGWLNASVHLSSTQPFSTRSFSQALMAQLQGALRTHDAEAAHLKFVLSSEGRAMWSSLVRVEGKPMLGGEEVGAVREAMLVINARVRLEPDELERLVREALSEVAKEKGVQAEVSDLQCFSPPYPRPPYRLRDPVASFKI